VYGNQLFDTCYISVSKGRASGKPKQALICFSIVVYNQNYSHSLQIVVKSVIKHIKGNASATLYVF